ncbi:hypothetical protein T4A_6829 [Trichinella pseudospiralis]|uniref:Uncharacterized protein n=1 Tax=Trichinella pseudospiralis TaxID=6337 RepID=A0A0V1E087_TRIPS|nr:hypothetical protein T4A_6829 [Trichinella pseudospiralis]
MYEEEKFETEEPTKGMFSIEVTKLICTLEIAVKIQNEVLSTPRKIIDFDQMTVRRSVWIHLIDFSVVEIRTFI